MKGSQVEIDGISRVAVICGRKETDVSAKRSSRPLVYRQLFDCYRFYRTTSYDSSRDFEILTFSESTLLATRYEEFRIPVLL